MSVIEPAISQTPRVTASTPRAETGRAMAITAKRPTTAAAPAKRRVHSALRQFALRQGTIGPSGIATARSAIIGITVAV
jgi:hypothetical protein